MHRAVTRVSSRCKVRLDQLLFQRGLAVSREAGRREILAGCVWVDGMREDKPGTMIRQDADIEIRSARPRFASRGGEKLAYAMEVFAVDAASRTAVDIGASTGGFTDVLLQAGASRVYSVDVGYGQLAWNLRQDPRVVVMDRTNARYLTPAMFDPRPDLATVDVSFISLSKILPALSEVLVPASEAVCLVKPQFEAGRERVGKRGVVRCPKVHIDVLMATAEHVWANGFEAAGVAASPIRGPKGNIEFLMHMFRGEQGDRGRPLAPLSREQLSGIVLDVVAQAHRVP